MSVLDVARGERIVVCGPSGSGKSTLIRCINHLEAYQKGEIRVGGIPALGTNEAKTIDAVRREVGIVFQHFNLFPHLTAIDNVRWLRSGSRNIRGRKPKRRAGELQGVGLGRRLKKYPEQLSGGQQQRVASRARWR